MGSSGHKAYQVLGVRIDALRMSAAADMIVRRSEEKGPAYVTKPYVEFMVKAHRDPGVRQLLNGSFLSLPDGVSLQWATAFLYGGQRTWWRALGLAGSIVLRPAAVSQQVPEKFSGATFTWKVLEAAARTGKNVYLVGSPVSNDIRHTAQVITHRLPSLKISGSWPGAVGGLSGRRLESALGTGTVSPTDLAADINKAGADVILIGMGFPLQEKLIAALMPLLKRGVLIGEGGTFDYDSFGGSRKRAPEAWRRLGMEWLWRLILEPKRLGRQLAIPRFMWAVYRTKDGAQR